VTAPRYPDPVSSVVLATLPPFFHYTWLGAGVVRLAHILNDNGVPTRLIRPLADLNAVPEDIRLSSLATLALDVPLATRMARLAEAAAQHPALFAEILDRLLSGGEGVVALSIWRTNVDLTLQVCQMIRQRRPEVRIILGGPEAIERKAILHGPWADAVVSGSGDDVIVPLATAMLDGHPGRGRRLAHTWIAPEHLDDGGPLAKSTPPTSPIDYAALLPLVAPDTQPRLPTVLNVGCVFRCAFCTNQLVYPETGWGSVETCAEEIRRIAHGWRQAYPDRPDITVELCDATINGWPSQFTDLCTTLITAGTQAQCSANWVVDPRVTEAVVERAAEAGITQLFFGLESGCDRIRKVMKKPGTSAQVWSALQRADRASGGRVHVGFGVIVGWPDETEAEYHQTVSMLERIAGLDGLSPNANVSPLFTTDNAQGRAAMGDLEGPSYGVLWRGSDAAGDPELRCRRMMGIVEHFGGVLRVDCPVPVEILAGWMLPPDRHDFLARWTAHNILPPPPEPSESSPEPPLPPPPPEPLPPDPPIFPEALLVRLFSLGRQRSDRLLVSVTPQRGEVQILDGAGRELLLLLLTPRDDARPCYRRTANFNVVLPGQSHSPTILALTDRLLDRVVTREAAQ
jgi:hypothetical protein